MCYHVGNVDIVPTHNLTKASCIVQSAYEVDDAVIDMAFSFFRYAHFGCMRQNETIASISTDRFDGDRFKMNKKLWDDMALAYLERYSIFERERVLHTANGVVDIHYHYHVWVNGKKCMHREVHSAIKTLQPLVEHTFDEVKGFDADFIAFIKSKVRDDSCEKPHHYVVTESSTDCRVSFREDGQSFHVEACESMDEPHPWKEDDARTPYNINLP